MGRAPLQPMGTRMGLMMTMTVRTLLACIRCTQHAGDRSSQLHTAHGQGSFVHSCIKSPADEQPCENFCVTARLQLQYLSCLHFLDPICVIGKFQRDETNVQP